MRRTVIDIKIKYIGIPKIVKFPVEVLKDCGDGLFIHHPWNGVSENTDMSLYKVSTIKGYGCGFSFKTLEVAEEYAEALKEMQKGWESRKITQKLSAKRKAKFKIIKKNFLKRGGIFEERL